MQAWALQSLQAKRMTLFSFSATPEQGNAPYKNPDMLMAGWMFLWGGETFDLCGLLGRWDSSGRGHSDALTNLIVLQRLVEAQNPPKQPSACTCDVEAAGALPILAIFLSN